MDLKSITLAYSWNWKIIKYLKFQYLITIIYKDKDMAKLVWFKKKKTKPKDENIFYKPA